MLANLKGMELELSNGTEIRQCVLANLKGMELELSIGRENGRFVNTGELHSTVLSN